MVGVGVAVVVAVVVAVRVAVAVKVGIMDFPTVDGLSGSRELELQVLKVMAEAFALWKERHRKYGPRNIGMFGATGCVVRCGDKVARLALVYLKEQGAEAQDESVEDSWLDLLNYAAMGLTCHRGMWK